MFFQAVNRHRDGRHSGGSRNPGIDWVAGHARHGECGTSTHRRNRSRQLFLLNLAAVLALLLCGQIKPAHAHGVVVFAWVEGDTVHVESKFAGGRKVNAGKVVVLDPQGTELLSGTTDAQGRYDFRVPAKTDLKIVLQAGMGHRGEWTVSAAEIEASGQASPAEPPGSSSSAVEKPAGPPTAEQARGSDKSPAAPDLAAIEDAVEKILDRKLKPVVRMIAETRQSGPSLKDILGGIGYILGLIGIGAYVHSRKKS
jgi:nickel transport protein